MHPSTLAGLAAVGLAASATAAPPLDLGEAAGELTLPSLADGSPLSLSEYRGRKVMLLVFASW